LSSVGVLRNFRDPRDRVDPGEKGDKLDGERSMRSKLDPVSIPLDVASLPLRVAKARSSIAGFLFEPNVWSMSRGLSDCCTRVGNPLAMADEDVCCEIDRGSFDLSYHERIVEDERLFLKVEAMSVRLLPV
jgi:hypothetical protein